MNRYIELSTQEGWIGPIVDAAKSAEPGDTIVVHSTMQEDFLRMELATMGKLGVKTLNTHRRNPSSRAFHVRDSSENAAKLVNWIQIQARAARQHI